MPRRSWPEIVATMSARRRADAPLIRRMIVTRDHVNGDVVVPLVDIPERPEMNELQPALVQEGVEGTAMRAAGPSPNIHVPALDPLKDKGKRSLEYAAIRRRALYARWHQSRLPLILMRAFRQLVAYGTFGMVVMPRPDGGAKIEFRDALGAYPELRSAEDLREPENVGFVYGRSADWVRASYPRSAELVGRWQDRHPEEQLWDLVEWIDDTDIVVGILGPRSQWTAVSPEAAAGMELRRVPNRAEMVPAVVPRRVTLDRVAGQVERIVKMEEWAARLMALDVIAAERGVFPDLVVLGQDGRTPQIISGGQWQDGRTGQPNILTGVQAVNQLHTTPGPMTTATIDRLERNARISGGVSPFFGGETIGSLRTGRAIDALGGYALDPRIAELQTIMGYALETVNRAICAVERGHFPKQRFFVFSGWPSDKAIVEYVPEQHFETAENTVSYTFPGADASTITVAVAQLNAARLMSRHTARDKHPFIEDAELEDRLVVDEAVDDAMLAAWERAIVTGQVSWQALASYKQKISGGMPWADAILAVNLEEQERQARLAQAAQAQQVTPETQPGLGGGVAPVPPVPPPPQGVMNVAAMANALAAGVPR